MIVAATATTTTTMIAAIAIIIVVMRAMIAVMRADSQPMPRCMMQRCRSHHERDTRRRYRQRGAHCVPAMPHSHASQRRPHGRVGGRLLCSVSPRALYPARHRVRARVCVCTCAYVRVHGYVMFHRERMPPYRLPRAHASACAARVDPSRCRARMDGWMDGRPPRAPAPAPHRGGGGGGGGGAARVTRHHHHHRWSSSAFGEGRASDRAISRSLCSSDLSWRAGGRAAANDTPLGQQQAEEEMAFDIARTGLV